jgi:hypothetical protein
MAAQFLFRYHLLARSGAIDSGQATTGGGTHEVADREAISGCCWS